MKRVALIYDATLDYDVKVMTGVAAFVQESGDFSIFVEETALKDQRLPDLQHWTGDGIIADFDHPVVATAVARSNLPIVAFGGGYGYTHGLSVPYFYANNKMIADMAAEHLVGHGLRNFAYCGYARTAINGWSEERQLAFAEGIRKRGFFCDVYVDRLERGRQWTYVQRSLEKWLKSLPKPVGIMAANDRGGRHVLEACRVLGLRVPEEVAVVGVDNDKLLCSLSSPALTSIEQGAHRIGYEAASLLNRLMARKRSGTATKDSRQRRFVIDPVGVVARQSTEVFAVDDAIASTAMNFIVERACDGIKAKDVAEAAAVSRSGLEVRFRDVFGYSVYRAIRRVQLEKSRRLISETNIPLKQVAASVGFRSVQHLTTLFGREFHYSPAKYREVTFSRSSRYPEGLA